MNITAQAPAGLSRTRTDRRGPDAVRLYPTLGLLLVLLASTVQNFAGVAAGLLFAISMGELRGGRIPIGGFAGAFFVAAAYAALRTILPSPIPATVQIEEAVRFASFAVIAAAAVRMRINELIRVMTLFLVLMACLYPVYLLTGWFSIVDAAEVQRFSGILPHANHLGYISASTAVALVYLKFARNFTMTHFWLLIALCGGLIVASRSSGGLLVLVAGLAAIPISVRPNFKRVAFSFFGIVVAIGLLLSPIGQLAIEKLQGFDVGTMLTRSSRHEFGNQGSFAWRLSYWLAIVDSHVANGPTSIAFGQGGGATTEGHRVFSFMQRDTHSDFVRVFVEYGLIGLVLVYGMLVRPVIRAGAKLVGLVIFFGPMLAGNSLISTPVMIVLITMIVLLSKVNGRWQRESQNFPLNAAAKRNRQYR
ncbi:O-antigen ligase [Altererythrobacter atlanticus]|uniref:O-antigen ligase family protein n=1 Tax=Croceibacterium atlanticum TaxID=1267766 RepID=UPI001470769F|nr:O-antigen ligase family protein [Croceibacterium atlanticum]MBB5734118.1 O-antigen ligase [Croceibacterium atlanticum]